MKSIFTGKVMETQWQLGHCFTFGDETSWRLNDRYIGVCYPIGWSNVNAKEYNRILSREEIHTGDFDFILKKNDTFSIDGEKVRIENIIFNSDNSITYHTDNTIKNEVLITKEEAEKRK